MAKGETVAEPWEVGDNPSVSPEATVVATAPETTNRRAIGHERLTRWLFTAVLSSFLIVSVAGVLGVRSATTSTSGGGYDLRVTYAAVTRPGLATPFAIEVSTQDGSRLDEPVTLAVSSRYMAMFDENGLAPAPSTETSTEDEVVWEFDPPGRGDTLRIVYDGRLEPAVHWGRDGYVQIIQGGAPVAEARFHTWVTP